MAPQLEFWFKLILAGLLVYIGVAALVYQFQSRLLYFPRAVAEHASTPAQAGLSYQDAWITTVDGVRLHGWYLPRPQARRVILFFHGNAGNIADRLHTARMLREFDAAVLMLDYRGYGRSQGRPTEAGTYADADAAWQYLLGERRWKPGQIVIWGRSLGGAVATYLAARQMAAALIVESSFSSLPDLAAELYPWLPARRLSRFDYDSRRRLTEVRSPVLVIHSREDEIIPFHHALALFEAAREPRQLLAIGGGHNAVFEQDGAHYRDGVRQFLAGTDRANPR